MDPKLFAYLERQCQFIKPHQCIYSQVDDDEQCDKYAGSNGAQLTLLVQVLNLYTRKLHPFIPDLEAVWKLGDYFYVRTSSTRGMQPLSTVMHELSSGVLFGILGELCTALLLIHGWGVHHGLVHETTLLVSGDMQRIYTKGIGFIDTSAAAPVESFPVRKAHDFLALRLMFTRVANTRRLAPDFVVLQQHLMRKDMHASVNELRALAWRENSNDRLVLVRWQETIIASVLATHEVAYIPVDLAGGGVFFSCMREFLKLAKDRLILPVFVDQHSIERGASAAIPVVNALFDFFVLNGLLAVQKDCDGLLPAPLGVDRMGAESTRFAYTLLGYLIAHVFVLRIPMQCQLSSLLVMCVMHDSMSDVTAREGALLKGARFQIGCMRAGAARLTSLPYFSQLPITRLFDFFYSCANNTTLARLGVEHFDFPQAECFTVGERSTVMQWLRGLDDSDSARLTLLMTNSSTIQKNTAHITIRKNTTHLSISTCEHSIDIPEPWLAGVATLRENMRLQINDLTFNKI